MGNEYAVVGTMSGTSLDGLDIVVSKFIQDQESEEWKGHIQSFCSIAIPMSWQSRIRGLHTALATEWHQASVDWAAWCAGCIRESVDLAEVDLVVFSGQTVFHRPSSGWTGQLGNGATMYAGLNQQVPVVCDLRSLDVALGGQGAPLIPVVDALLFGQYETCLNLGGFANVSATSPEDGRRIAHDIGPCNLVLNHFAERLGKPYDTEGKLAAQGSVQEELWRQWMALPYHQKPPPKSLGTEWLEASFWPVLNAWEREHSSRVQDLLATTSAYIASLVRLAINGKSTLITGGGAHNKSLVAALKAPASEFILGPEVKVIMADQELNDGKEAHGFGFLGLLRALGQDNVWESVTGSRSDHLGGALWGSFDRRGT